MLGDLQSSTIMINTSNRGIRYYGFTVWKLILLEIINDSRREVEDTFW